MAKHIWFPHDGKGVPPQVVHRVVVVQYNNSKYDEFFVDPETWVEPGSAWEWGTWSTKIIRWRFAETELDSVLSGTKAEVVMIDDELVARPKDAEKAE